MTEAVRVVLIGGGYTSVWTYRALRRRLGTRVEVTVVSDADGHVFHGWTGEVVAGELSPGTQHTSLSAACPRARHLRGTAVGIDLDRRVVQVATDSGLADVAFDHVVLATGVRERVERVTGLAEHGSTLRGTAGPAGVSQQWAAHVAAADDMFDTDPLVAPGLRTAVVVGGGLAGVETAAALVARCPTGQVLLVTSSATLAGDLGDKARLVRRIERDLRELGVEVRVATRVVEVMSTGCRLSDGSFVSARLVVAALGTEAVPLAGLESLTCDARGRLVTDATLQVAPGVWAGGDCAAVPAVRGGTCPPTALWAIRQGTAIGRGIVRASRGRAPRAFRYRGLGRAASLGRGRGIVEIYGIALTGWPAWVMRLGFFLWFVPTRRGAMATLGEFVRRPAVPAVVTVPTPRTIDLTRAEAATRHDVEAP